MRLADELAAIKQQLVDQATIIAKLSSVEPAPESRGRRRPRIADQDER
jgi:hypothetical protein